MELLLPPPPPPPPPPPALLAEAEAEALGSALGWLSGVVPTVLVLVWLALALRVEEREGALLELPPPPPPPMLPPALLALALPEELPAGEADALLCALWLLL